MKKLSSLIATIFPGALTSFQTPGSTTRNYRQFKLALFAIMLAIAMGPVVMVAGLGYTNYNTLLRNEERDQLQWQLDGSIRAIQQMVESLKSVVQFSARSDRYTELVTGKQLEHLFIRIKRLHPSFADLGVIDGKGIQQAYYGPYDLKGKDYSQEQWFRQAFDQGLYISEVYTGYRNVPHFAIAVSNLDPTTRKLWILRATIDAVTLQQFINTIKTNAADDIFLIGQGGSLQTTSAYYGASLSTLNRAMTRGLSTLLSPEGETLFHAVGTIEDTPWTLVLIKKQYIHHADWQDFRRNLYLIVSGCLALSLIVVYSLVTLIARLIRKADDTQLAMLQDAEHTDKLASIGRLAAGVGHEINNPLAIIQQKTGLIEDLLLISEDFGHKTTIGECLKGINQSIERCKAITHRLLGFARRADVFREKFHINDVVRDVLQFLDNAMLYNRIKADLRLQDSLPLMTSDRMQLQQIFLNIINNAIDAIGKDGTISILSHMVAGEIRVVIQDNGPGIPDDILPHIFEPFYTTKETGKGTGLGLSITYGILKKLGGDITVRSNLGQGTAFTITLPLECTAQE